MNRVLCLFVAILLLIIAPSLTAQKIIISSDSKKGSIHMIALEEFTRLVEKYSNGELETELHYQGNKEYPAIRGEEVNVNMLKVGSQKLHMTSVYVGNLSQKTGVLNFLTLPYMFSDVDAAKKLFESDFMRIEINQKLIEQYNIRAIGWLMGGFRRITNSKRSITKLEDMEGLKLRISKNKLLIDSYRNFGATVVPLDWNKTFDAMKNKEVDGQENPYGVIVSAEFWNANQRYLTKNDTFLWSGPLLMNNTFYMSLPAKYQSIIDRAALEASQYQWKWIEEQDSNLEDILIKKGFTINELEDKEKWIQATRSVWEKYYKTIGDGDEELGKDIVDNALEIMSR